MKKLLLVLIVVGAGAAVWYFLLASTPRRACDREVALCDAKEARTECDEYFEMLAKQAPDSVASVSKCVIEAKSCGEAVGCQAGGVVKIGIGFGRGLLDGLQKSLAK